MPYIGTFTSAPTLRFESNANIKGSITVHWLRQGGTVDIELLEGTNPFREVAIPRKTDRVVFAVSPGSGGWILFKVSQGTVAVEETVVVDAQFVFDVL